MDISALGIANIYRNRWQIEIFLNGLSWIWPSNECGPLWECRANTFVDSNYLLSFNGKIKAELQTQHSITEVARVMGVSVFTKTPIQELLTNDQSTIENQNVKELKLFLVKFIAPVVIANHYLSHHKFTSQLGRLIIIYWFAFTFFT